MRRPVRILLVMSIDKKALIAQIADNVRLPDVEESSQEREQPAPRQKRPRVSRAKSGRSLRHFRGYEPSSRAFRPRSRFRLHLQKL